MKLPVLLCWRDDRFRTAAEQMALDEALFRLAGERRTPVARFYAWGESAVTEGYFAASRDPASPPETEAAEDRETPSPVRRLTGGGRVEHGEDLTFLLAVPAGEALASAPGPARYRFLHEAVLSALAEVGAAAALKPDDGDATATGPCFANPVPWDLVDPASGGKIGGGAQRRTRGALIHQGSLRLPEALRHPAALWIDGLLARLAERAQPLPEEWREEAGRLADALAADRYDNPEWNRPARRGPAPKSDRPSLEGVSRGV